MEKRERGEIFETLVWEKERSGGLLNTLQLEKSNRVNKKKHTVFEFFFKFRVIQHQLQTRIQLEICVFSADVGPRSCEVVFGTINNEVMTPAVRKPGRWGLPVATSMGLGQTTSKSIW